MEYVGGGRWRRASEGGHRLDYIGGGSWRIRGEDGEEEDNRIGPIGGRGDDKVRRYYIKWDVSDILRRGRQKD